MHHPGGFHWLGLDDQHDLRSLSLCRTVTFLRGVFPIGGILPFLRIGWQDIFKVTAFNIMHMFHSLKPMPLKQLDAGFVAVINQCVNFQDTSKP